MSVPTNLIPTLITGLQEYTGSSTLGYMPYILDGRTYKVQFANIAAVGAVPSSRVIAAGTGLAGGGDLSANRVISIANGGVGFDQLALSGVAQGTYGSGSAVPILTVDSKGRITSATTAPLDVTGFVPNTRTITAGDGLAGGGALTSNVTLAANFSAATPSALGTASAGTAITVSRGDHVHPAVNLSDTSQTQGALPLGRGGTGDALSPVAGAVVYSTGSKFALTNPGIVGQVLVSAGTDEPQWQTILGTGTVTSVSVSTANGFAGFVANPATVPDITLSTTVTGMLKGDGTGMSAATAGVDYVEPGPYTTSGLTMASARLLGRTTASVGAAQEITVGTGLTLSGGSLVNAAPDQVVALTGGTAISVTGTYPSFTITNTAPDQTVSLTAGTAISISGTYPSFSVTNTAPDQVVSLTGAGTTTVTGTYPSFTITSNDSTSGTVTSVNASGGTTGMSFTGGPITSAGTLTLNGTLAVANGGTGATDAATALTNLGAYPASNPAGYTTNVGTVTSVSGTGTVSGLSLSGTVTSAGSLTLGGTLAVTPSDFASQTANTVLAAPNGSAGVPTFRSLVAADVPTLNQNTTGTASNVTGIVAVANGGTGASVAGTARTNLGAAASGANTDITSIALTTGTISTSPVNGTDIVNKAYADSIASGINFHQSVRLATAAALPANTYNNGTSGVGATLTANANGALSVDGVAVAVGNRILVKNEATQANNGVYTVTQVGNGSTPYILTRATDFDSSGSGVDQIDAGDFFLVTAGSTLANTSWVQQTPLPITVGTTAIVFSQFAAPVLYSAGTGLSLTGTTFSITNTGVSASTYGSASSVPVIAVNAQGQITSASASSIAIAASQITSGALAIANGGTGATSAATALTNLGAYPASNPSGFTSNTGTVTSVNLTAGTGVSVSGGPITASGSITVTNTAPDQVVSLTGSGATTVTGTYPNFTISSTAGGAGTVTSINVSGGTTGLTTSGGPVTSSGTITLAGTLNVANGGTGATTLSSGYVLKGNGTSAVSASVIYDDGTNAMVGGTSAFGRFTVEGNTNANLDIWIRNNNAGSSSRTGLVLNASGNSWRMGMGSSANNSNALTWNLDVGGANTEYMRLTTGGNLGLGTNAPTVQFQINGTQPQIQWSNPTTGTTSSDGTHLYLSSADFWLVNKETAAMVFATDNSERMRINSSGNVTANVDIRAPIFYDSNNTGYYGDFASTSVLFNLTISGGGNKYLQIQSTDSGEAMVRYMGATGSSWYVGKRTTSQLVDTASFHFYSESAGATVGGIDVSGNMLASGSMRAPVFYDLNNTAYFVDPNNTSNLVGLTVANEISGNISGYSRYLPTAYIGGVQTNPQTYFSSSIGLKVAMTAVAGVWSDTLWINGYAGGDVPNMCALHTSRQATPRMWISSQSDVGTSYGTLYEFPTLGYNSGNTNGLYAGIYYDSANTGYYVDPASTSVLYQINTGIGINLSGGLALNGSGATLANSIGARLTENYGPLWNCDNSATWHHQVINGSMLCGFTAGGTNWGSGKVVANGDMRAPIFYDYNNTAYYLDPASNFNFLVGGYVTYTGTTSGLYVTNAESTGAVVRLGAAYNLPGIYSNTSMHVQSESAIYFRISNGQKGYIDSASNLVMDGSVQAPIFYDSSNTGYYIDPAANVGPRAGYLNGNLWINPKSESYGEGVTFNMPSQGTWGGLRWYRNSSPFTGNWAFGYFGNEFNNDIGFHNGVNGWRLDHSFNNTVNGSVRAPIFYKNTNTGFYLDPYGTSNVEMTCTGTWYFLSNRNTSSSGAPLQAFSTGGFGATMAFHRAGIFAVNMGLDSDNVFRIGGWSASNNLIQLDMSGNFTALTSSRAPIFYDSNNTSFYVDPQGGSAFQGALIIGPNTSGKYTRFGGNGGATDMSTVSTSNGNLHLDAETGSNIYLAWYNTSTVNVGGSVVANGNITAYSDIRVKDNVETIPSALDKLDQIRGVTYTRTDLEDKERRYAGVIAQEIEQVLPEAVFENEEYKSVDYNATIGLLIQAVKELTDKVKALEAKEQ